MASQWGGPDVRSGNSVKWGVVFLTGIGSPLLAVYYGFIDAVGLIGDGYEWALTGFESFINSYFEGLLLDPARALYSAVERGGGTTSEGALTGAWGSFLDALTANGFGLFTFFVTVVATLLVLFAALTVVTRLYG